MKTIAIVGGDKREEVLINLLAEKGYNLQVFNDNTDKSKENVKYFKQIEKVITKANLVLAPMSGTDKDGYLKANFTKKRLRLDRNFVDLLESNTIFAIGTVRPYLKNLLQSKGIRYIELAQITDLAILNAIPTAEGAIQLAINETDYTIYGSKTIVLGLGKIGLPLAWRLRLLGAESYAVTRDKTAIARGRDLGIKMLSYQNIYDYLPQMDLLFNTVPSLIITEDYLKLLKKESLIIDLASSPGGTDFQAAEKLRVKALLAVGLPGKIAPQTAGEILAEKISDLI